MADELTLEIVEGPGAGRRIVLARPIVIGRAPETDFPLEDAEVSRHHASVSPTSDGAAVVEDLGSANGTFVNHNQLQGAARLDPGDELLVGVTLILARSRSQVEAQRTIMRAVPPALASAPRRPDYVNEEMIRAQGAEAPAAHRTPELEKYLDVRVRRRAQLAPLALFLLVALALIIYFATR